MSVSVSTPAAPQRYHPAQVTLHWIIAALVFVVPLLASEGEGERGGAPSTIAGMPLIGIHMVLGITVLVLLLIRLIIRWRIRRPDWATTGSGFLDRIGQWTHIGLYFFTFAVTVTGLIFALQTNRLARTFSAAPNPPRQFQPGQFPPPGEFQEGGEGPGGFRGGLLAAGRFAFRAFHELSWQLLLLLIILHVGAALFHQFWRRDHLLSRMWYGRSSGPKQMR